MLFSLSALALQKEKARKDRVSVSASIEGQKAKKRTTTVIRFFLFVEKGELKWNRKKF
jgi:hypothetical protein